jgi:beta-xylosidase
MKEQDDFDFNKLILPVSRKSILEEANNVVWCGTIQKGPEGRFWMLYSRWPKSAGHNAWVTQSEVAVASSESPLGPWRYETLALKGSGNEGAWDRDCIHNPTMIKVGEKYYLYYMANYGNGEFWDHRNHQRVGVAWADHPRGPWHRSEAPCIDVSVGAIDHLMTANPSVCVRPDGKILMIYKAVGDGALPKGGAVICGAAVADDPLGPFTKLGKPLFVNPENPWSVEDPYVWYQKDRYYVLAKDFQGYFTGKEGGSVALFESFDGFDWKPAKHSFAFKIEFVFEDGEKAVLEKLERPQLWIDEMGVPRVLCCAACYASDTEKIHAFNVQIPLAGN